MLGFGNAWYTAAVENALIIELPSGKPIRMVSAPYFLITKLEAFDGRGGGDYLMSHDMEDIVAVLDGRPELLDEIKHAQSTLVLELARRFQVLLKDERFVNSISGHMPTDESSQRRVSGILEIIRKVSVVM